MQPGAGRKASGLLAILLVPLRARAHVSQKLGQGWAMVADALILGGVAGAVAALALDVSGEMKLGIFAGSLAVAALAGVAVGRARRNAPKADEDTQP